MSALRTLLVTPSTNLCTFIYVSITYSSGYSLYQSLHFHICQHYVLFWLLPLPISALSYMSALRTLLVTPFTNLCTFISAAVILPFAFFVSIQDSCPYNSVGLRMVMCIRGFAFLGTCRYIIPTFWLIHFLMSDNNYCLQFNFSLSLTTVIVLPVCNRASWSVRDPTVWQSEEGDHPLHRCSCMSPLLVVILSLVAIWVPTMVHNSHKMFLIIFAWLLFNFTWSFLNLFETDFHLNSFIF